MENRFGVKDLILFSLIVIVIVMVALAMKQFDRQYQVVRDLQHQGQDQLRELVAIHSALEHGAITSATTNPSSADASGSPDPFASLREMRQAGKYDEGDWLVRNFPVQVAKITPLLSTDVYAAVLEARVIESLAYRDPETLNWVPLLATSWKITDNTKAWNDFVQQRKSVPLTEQEIIKEGDCPPADKAAERQRYIDVRLKEWRRREDLRTELD